MERIRDVVVSDIVDEIRQVPPWRVWQHVCLATSLKMIHAYHAHLALIAIEGEHAPEEIESIKRSPAWYKIKLILNG